MPAVHVAADDRTPAVGVRALGDRIAGTGRAIAGVRVETLALLPAPVDARLPAGCVVDLLVRVLPDVADPHVAGCPVEREPPGIAQPPHPRLALDARTRSERVVLRHAVGRVARRSGIDPEDLGERRRQVLPVALRITFRTAVAEPDVQHA